MENWYLGTMGVSYKDWRGPFYPEYLESRDYLEYYSRYFNAVEIDSTFYGTPQREYVERWEAVTPEDFIICVKTPRAITHEAGLVGVKDEMDAFLDTVSLLGNKLGVILVQFPPSFAINQAPALAAFLKDLPGGFRFAVEVRHPSWYTERTGKLFEKRRVAWATTEYEDLPQQISITTDFMYVRFIGRHGVYPSHERERVDATEKLNLWSEQIKAHLNEVSTVFGFFNNDYAGFAPGTCNRFKELLGLPAQPFTPPRQDRLF